MGYYQRAPCPHECHPPRPPHEFDPVVEVMERDHNKLENRDEANQHPISAISGLQDKLDLIAKSFELQQQENQLLKERIQMFQEKIQSLENEVKALEEEIEDLQNNGSGGSSTDDPTIDEDNIATDEEVDDMLDDIFGEDAVNE